MLLKRECHSKWNITPNGTSLKMECHSKWNVTQIWVTIQFEWHSNLSDNPFWVTLHFEWHSILSDIPFWVTLHFEWHSILSDIQFWVMRSEGSEESEGLSISKLRVSERPADLEMLAHLKTAPDDADRQTATQTHGHGNSMIESAQWGRFSEKTYRI